VGPGAAILLSFMASCKANQVEAWAYVRAAISELARQPRGVAVPPDLLASLLPDAWLDSHPEVHRPWSR
jgi:transposase